MQAILKPLSVVAVIAALSTMTSFEAEARRVFPANGGKGDRQQMVECRPGWYIIGFSGRVGAWIDQMSLICARHNADNTIAEKQTLGPFGGGGGGPVEVNCPRGAVVNSVSYSMTDEHRQVEAMRAGCMPLGGGNGSVILFGNTDKMITSGGIKLGVGNNPATSPENCDAGDAAVGMQINFGRHVNSTGLICDELKRASPPSAQVPPKKIISSAGKAKTTSDVPAAPRPPADPSLEKWLGTWSSVTSTGRMYIIEFTGSGRELSGTFKDVAGNVRVNGMITGTPDGSTLNYRYHQPALPGKGTGTFVLNAEGKRFSGGGLVDNPQKTTFTWKGEKIKAAAGPN